MARRNFLAYFFLTSCLVSGESPRYVLKGQKVTLVTKDITGQLDNILWKHDGDKVVEFNGREEHVYDPYKTRVTLDWLSAELDITDLRLEDSGKYELEVSVNKKLEKSYHDMEVLDRVAKPAVSCNINNSTNSGTLVCSAEPRQPVHLMMFEWHSQGSVHLGPHLQISLGDEHDDRVYNCTVRNPLTTETAAFTAKDCYTTKSSSVVPIAVAVVISLLLLIVGAGIFYYYKKQKGCFAKRQRDVENQKPYIRNGSGGTVETDEATPFIDGKSSSGKSSVGADKVDRGAAETEQLSESADKAKQQDELNSPTGVSPGTVRILQNAFEEKHNIGQNKDDINNTNTTVEEGQDKHEGYVPNKSESPAESADVNQTTSSEQKSSTAPASPDTVEDPSKTDKSDSDPEQSSKVPLEKASDPAAVGPGTGPDSEPEPADLCFRPSDDSSVHEESDGQKLYESAEEEKQQDADSDKNQHQPSDDSSVHEDSDGQQLYESAEEEKQQDAGDPEPNNESDNDHEVELPGRKSSTSSDGSGSNNNQHQPSDDSSIHEDSDGHQLEEPTEEEKQQDAGDPEPNDESTDGHKVELPGRKSSTASDDSGSNKNQHQSSDDSSIDDDSDGLELHEPTDKETQSTGDPEPNDESTDKSKDLSSERKCSTSSDDSDQKRSDHPKAEASSSPVTLPDAAQTKDDVKNKNTPVEERLSEGSDKQEGHASNKSESAAESADVNQDPSSEHISSSGPASPDTVDDSSNTDKSDSDSEQSSKVPLGKATDTAFVGPGTGPHSEPEPAGSNNNQHQPSDDSSVHEDSDGQQLEEPADKETQSAGDPEPNNESNEDHEVALSGRKSSTSSDDSGSNQYQSSDDVHKDSDGPAETQHGAGDPETNDVSANRSKDVSNASDGSGLETKL